MKIVIFIFTTFVTICLGEVHSNGPLVYPNWPPKSTKNQQQSLTRPQIMMKLHTNPQHNYQHRAVYYKRPTVMAQRVVRPMVKVTTMPHFYNMKNPQYQHQASAVYYTKSVSPPSVATFSKMKFKSSPQVTQHNGEYIFETPFPRGYTPRPFTSTSTNIIHLTNDKKHSPIHTIPAPNLSLQGQQYKNVASSTTLFANQLDNHNYEKKSPNFAPIRSTTMHQYQVTEPTNDHTIRDPISGQKKLYAPDPDPSLPAHKIQPATDPFSQPSQIISQNNHQQQPSVNIFTVHQSPSVGTASALIQNSQSQSQTLQPPQTSYIQLSNSVAQQQLPDSYAIPLDNQPQLQQHFLQQQSLFQGMPLSVYNPTYLVTQSNQLFNEHNKQRLFKPAPDFFDTQTNLLGSSSDLNSIASPGQIYTATQDAIQDIQNELTLQSLKENDNNKLPSYAALVGARQPTAVNEQPLLTQQDLANLLNYGKLENNDQQSQHSFVASTFYDTKPTAQQQNEIDTNMFEDIATIHQRHNDEIIAQANEELEKQLQTQNAAHFGNSIDVGSDDAIATSFDDSPTVKSPFRIFVADEDYDGGEQYNESFLKRSDDEDRIVAVNENKKEIKLPVESTTVSIVVKEEDEAEEIKRTTESIAFGQRRTPTRKNDIKDKTEKKAVKV